MDQSFKDKKTIQLKWFGWNSNNYQFGHKRALHNACNSKLSLTKFEKIKSYYHAKVSN